MATDSNVLRKNDMYIYIENHIKNRDQTFMNPGDMLCSSMPHGAFAVIRFQFFGIRSHTCHIRHAPSWTMSPLSLDEEARLYTTNAEREKYESQATLFGVIVALDYLERAYVRDSIPASE